MHFECLELVQIVPLPLSLLCLCLLYLFWEYFSVKTRIFKENSAVLKTILYHFFFFLNNTFNML